jgi:hypothetical protein
MMKCVSSSRTTFPDKEMNFNINTGVSRQGNHFPYEHRHLLESERSLFQKRRVSVTIPITLSTKDLDRQVKLEVDAIHDGIIRYPQSRAYQLATDTKLGG